MKYYSRQEFRKRVQAVRKQEGLKQVELAEEMNISRDMLSRIEKHPKWN